MASSSNFFIEPPMELKRVDAARFKDCVRASGLSEPQFAPDLAHAQKQSECRDRAIASVKAKDGAVALVFDQAKYQACLDAP